MLAVTNHHLAQVHLGKPDAAGKLVLETLKCDASDSREVHMN